MAAIVDAALGAAWAASAARAIHPRYARRRECIDLRNYDRAVDALRRANTAATARLAQSTSDGQLTEVTSEGGDAGRKNCHPRPEYRQGGSMARTGTKPGKGTYECSKCGTRQELKTAASTLKRCDDCGSELFRKARSSVAV